MEREYELAVKELHRGNKGIFNIWLMGASKVDILNAIEFAMQESLFKRHQIINIMRSQLNLYSGV